MQQDCNSAARPARGRAIGLALVVVLMHFVLPWVHRLQHASCGHGSAAVASAHACSCAKPHCPEGAPQSATEDHAHDASQCVVCQQLRFGNPLLGGAPLDVQSHELAITATSAHVPVAPPRAIPLANAPARGPPLPV